MSTDYHPVVDAFVTDHRHSKEKGTQSSYRNGAQHFIDWLNTGSQVHLDDIADIDLNPDIVDNWVNALLDDYPESTTKTRFYSVSSFFNWLEEKGVLDENPASAVSIADYVDRQYTQTGEVMRAKKGIIYLSTDEIQQLITHVPAPRNRNELLIKLMLQTGLRPSEAVSIRLPDVDRDERRISVVTAKTGKIRDVWYQPSLALLMGRWLDTDRSAMPTATNTNHLFVTRYSAPMSSNRPNRVVKKAAEAAGIQETMFKSAAGSEQSKVTAKTLRHTFAVHAVRNGMDIRSLQMLMGHEQISTTEQYLRFSDETLRQKMMQHGPDTT